MVFIEFCFFFWYGWGLGQICKITFDNYNSSVRDLIIQNNCFFIDSVIGFDNNWNYFFSLHFVIQLKFEISYYCYLNNFCVQCCMVHVYHHFILFSFEYTYMWTFDWVLGDFIHLFNSNHKWSSKIKRKKKWFAIARNAKFW